MDNGCELRLREITESDLDLFFEHQLDPEANRMAAFTVKDPTDRAAFRARWRRIMADETMPKRTILVGRDVVGHILTYPDAGHLEVTYWIGREYWGRGFATRALAAFLDLVPVRPLYARAAQDNAGSIRVLTRCGFQICGEDKGFANGRGEEVAEYILKLNA